MNEEIQLIKDLGYGVDVTRKDRLIEMNLTLDSERIGQSYSVTHYFKNVGLYKQAFESGEIPKELSNTALPGHLICLSMRAVAHSIANDRVELDSVKSITDKYTSYILDDFKKVLKDLGHSFEKYQSDLTSIKNEQKPSSKPKPPNP
ncbi:hypothetical protein N0614_09450 [Pseudomonas aeruginosa]|nr:hypothetical protein [Pseudomonas aeruginosa]